MTADKSRIYWMEDDAWWAVVDNEFVLTDAAPQKARDSFNLWKTPPDPAEPIR